MCTRGMRMLPGADHAAEPVVAADQIGAWLADRLAGEPATSNALVPSAQTLEIAQRPDEIAVAVIAALDDHGDRVRSIDPVSLGSDG